MTPAYYLMAAAAVSLAAVLVLRETARRPLSALATHRATMMRWE
jgi:MHS family proline/betaine transporter-like MFS transporter